MYESAGKEQTARKRGMDLPCRFVGKDVHGNDRLFYPLVACDCDCSKCGWNPPVAKARIKAWKDRRREHG